MRSLVLAALSCALIASATVAEARGGRGFGFRIGGARTVAVPARPAAPARPGAVVLVGTRPAQARSSEDPAKPAPAATFAAAAAAAPSPRPEAPPRPWCEGGKVLGGLCVLN